VKRLKGRRLHSVYEAGPFGYGLHDWLVSRGVYSIVASPAHIPTEPGSRVKTDRRDSTKLAATLEAGLLRPIYIPDAHHRADRELVRLRERIQRHRRASMARLKSLFLTYALQPPFPETAHWGGPFNRWLEKLQLEDPVLHEVLEETRSIYFDLTLRVKRLQLRLREMARSQPYEAWTALLTSVPGIGELTAVTLATEVSDWSRFKDGEAFSSYAGLTPSEYSSGDTIRRGRITRAGNPTIRRVLVESSWILIRRDAGMRAFYEKVAGRRGPKKAIVAVARKLSHRLLAMARSGETYRLETPTRKHLRKEAERP
jgi:transposase